MKIQHFEEMARKMVGDGKEPNLFFVSVDGRIVAVTSSLQGARGVAGGYSDTHDIWVIEDRQSGIVDESTASRREQDRLATEEEAPAATGAPSVSHSDIATINRHRASIGMRPIDRATGWTDQELIEMAEQIRSGGRIHNPGGTQIKQRLLR